MNCSRFVGVVVRCLLPMAIAVFLATAAAQTAAPMSPASAAAAAATATGPGGRELVTLSLDRDLVTFVKAAVWAAGIFLAIFAALAVTFFGFDVRTARKSLLEASDDIRTRTEAIRKDHQSLIELKERLGKLGAELIEQIEKKTPAGAPTSQTEPPETEPNEPLPEGPLSDLEDKRSFLRQLLDASEFEWSTVGTLAKRMSLSRETVMALADGDPLVQRGVGRKGDVLFRLKRFNNPGGLAPDDQGPNGMTRQAWLELLWQHAAMPKKPRGGMVDKDGLF